MPPGIQTDTARTCLVNFTQGGTGGVHRLRAIPRRPSALRSSLPGGVVKCCPDHIFYDILLNYVNYNRENRTILLYRLPRAVDLQQRECFGPP